MTDGVPGFDFFIAWISQYVSLFQISSLSLVYADLRTWRLKHIYQRNTVVLSFLKRSFVEMIYIWGWSERTAVPFKMRKIRDAIISWTKIVEFCSISYMTSWAFYRKCHCKLQNFVIKTQMVTPFYLRCESIVDRTKDSVFASYHIGTIVYDERLLSLSCVSVSLSSFIFCDKNVSIISKNCIYNL